MYTKLFDGKYLVAMFVYLKRQMHEIKRLIKR